MKTPVLKGMTDRKFEAWWSEGRLSKEWFNLSASQQAKAKNIKLLFKTIATEDNVDHDLIYALMSLASNLRAELIRQRAYQRVRGDAERERDTTASYRQ